MKNQKKTRFVNIEFRESHIPSREPSSILIGRDNRMTLILARLVRSTSDFCVANFVQLRFWQDFSSRGRTVRHQFLDVGLHIVWRDERNLLVK
jgi:hypothetical protein